MLCDTPSFLLITPARIGLGLWGFRGSPGLVTNVFMRGRSACRMHPMPGYGLSLGYYFLKRPLRRPSLPLVVP